MIGKSVFSLLPRCNMAFNILAFGGIKGFLIVSEI